METPLFSIVVPTRDRADAVIRLLQALGRQHPVEGGYEAIVVADGCRDATSRRVAATAWPFDVHVLEQGPSGAATARNCGAALARGRILLFLDDDVEPEPGVLQAHARLHASQSRTIGLGYLPPVVSGGLLGAALRGWWEEMYDGPRRPCHRYTGRDLLSGHFSIARADFESCGGFDATLGCHEDWDLGYRAIGAGLQIRFVPDAVAWHHESSDLGKVLRRKFQEGIADVQITSRCPELTAALPIGWSDAGITVRSRWVRLAWDAPAVGDRLVARLSRLLAFYERWRLRFRWRALLERMMVYHYWRGVAQAVGSRERLAALLAAPPPPAAPEIVLDLARGVEAVEAELEARRPASVRLVHGDRIVGDMPAMPGAERLRGVHLREALARPLARSFARALAANGQMPPVVAGPKLAAAPADSPHAMFAA